jgi:hypothetical protein
MSRKPYLLTQSEVERFVRAAKKGGASKAQIAIDVDGRITIDVSLNGDETSPNKAEAELDRWLSKHARET